MYEIIFKAKDSDDDKIQIKDVETDLIIQANSDVRLNVLQVEELYKVLGKWLQEY